ncbi:MAG: LAGLIDADG family homing endonuclease [Parcubacteria group bacterium]
MVKKLQPWYIVGFVEGEGCFAINISKHKTKKIRRDAWLSFEIELRGDDKPILESIQKYFGCGNIYELNYDRYGWMPHAKYHLRGLDNIRRILIPFFRKYKLQGKKSKDFKLFCRAAEVFAKKEHLTKEGIAKLEDIRKFMNRRRPFKS